MGPIYSIYVALLWQHPREQQLIRSDGGNNLASCKACRSIDIPYMDNYAFSHIHTECKFFPFNDLFATTSHFSAMNSTVSVAEATSYLLTGFGRLFYVVSPSATSFSTLQEVPDYIAESIPFFVITIVLEFLSLLFSNNGKSLKKKREWDASRFSINDAVGSIGVRINRYH